jgi:hypothetical protein
VSPGGSHQGRSTSHPAAPDARAPSCLLSCSRSREGKEGREGERERERDSRTGARAVMEELQPWRQAGIPAFPEWRNCPRWTPSCLIRRLSAASPILNIFFDCVYKRSRARTPFDPQPRLAARRTLSITAFLAIYGQIGRQRSHASLRDKICWHYLSSSARILDSNTLHGFIFNDSHILYTKA